MSLHRVLDPAKDKLDPSGICALGIMTKVPQPGKVKTRLSPPLTPEQAADLNSCFLRDLGQSITRAASMAPARGVGVFTPAGAEAAYERIFPPQFLLIPQRGESFGERLTYAAEDLFRVGFGSVCLINSDSPTVAPESFAEAAIELADPRERVVLGPSHDGGYYLIGMKRLYRRLFEEIDWSTERVADQTRARAAELGMGVHELATGLDVDDGESLRRLCAQLDGNELPADTAAETRRFLSRLRATRDF